MSSRSWYLRENKPSVTICALSMIIIGILMVFAGGLTTYIYFTEITPPNYDAYYQRYVGSSFPRIFGILILMAGLILFWGASIFLVYVHWRDSNNNNSSSGGSQAARRHYQFEGTLPMTSTTSSTPVPTSTSYKYPLSTRENYIG